MWITHNLWCIELWNGGKWVGDKENFLSSLLHTAWFPAGTMITNLLQAQVRSPLHSLQQDGLRTNLWQRDSLSYGQILKKEWSFGKNYTSRNSWKTSQMNVEECFARLSSHSEIGFFSYFAEMFKLFLTLYKTDQPCCLICMAICTVFSRMFSPL